MADSRRRWGWHELRPTWAERLVTSAGVVAGDLVIDIGAGRGALTEPLVACGARVIAVERHPQRARELRQPFGTSVVVVEHDAADLRLPRRPFRVVASVPYAATSPILRRLVHPGSRLVAAHVIVQRQAAARWASPSAPSASRWQRTYAASIEWAVPRRAFTPPPQVDSCVLLLRRRPGG